MTGVDGGTAVQRSADRPAIERDILATLMPGFSGFSAPEWISQAFSSGLVSACVYGSNVRDREQLRALGHSLREMAPHALLAIDEEGGEVTRLSYVEGSPYPGAAVMGRIGDEAYSEEIGRRVANEMLSAGFNLALGPVADVNSNPLNPVIGTRSFGATPDVASRHVAAWVRGLEGGGAVACPKHFPGHGDTGQDSHHELPTVAASRALLARRDLPPFRAAFAARARAVMTSHIVLEQLDPDVPATFSQSILQGLLRDELGFEGVIVSDALDMQGASGGIGVPEAAVRALAAGCDLLCVGVDTAPEQLTEIVAHVARAVTTGRISPARIAEAAARVRMLSRDATPSPEQLRGQPAEPRAAVGAAELRSIVASFDGVDSAHDWLRDHPRATVIRVETAANMAVGVAPWGPFAAARSPLPGQHAAAASFGARGLRVLGPAATWGEQSGAGHGAGDVDGSEGSARELAASGEGTIVVGREIHRHAFARDAITALQRAGEPVLVVEMGWPAEGLPDSQENRYACLSTFGASALVGAALITLLESAAP